MAKIICAKCKAIEDVDEQPQSTETVLCSQCRAEDQSDGSSKRGRAGDQSGGSSKRDRQKHVPRKEHGTRVMLPITCSECGQTETLDYVPKGADLDEVLCSDCAREEFGTDSDWARMEKTKQRESDDREWKFECDECGRVDYLPFEPKPDREYQCNLCRLDHDTPNEERLRGREKAAGGVFIRRGGESDDS